MTQKGLVKRCAAGTGFFAACCFGVLGILGILGFTTALAYINNFGDYIFFPAYAAFGTVFVYALMQWKRNVFVYGLSAATIGVMIYFSFFGIIWFGLVLGGVLVGVIISVNLYKKSKSCEVSQ